MYTQLLTGYDVTYLSTFFAFVSDRYQFFIQTKTTIHSWTEEISGSHLYAMILDLDADLVVEADSTSYIEFKWKKKTVM